MDTLELLKQRKSTRAFRDEPITQEEKEIILRASLEAPSAGNMELYSMIDVVDQDMKDQLSDLCDHQPFIKKAPMVVIYCVDYTKWMDMFNYYGCNHEGLALSDIILALEDASIAASNAVVAAEALGIGSCFIGDVMENYEQMKELLHLPQYALPLVMLVFGKPTDHQKERMKPKRFSLESMVHTNTYQTKTIEQTKEMFIQQTGKSEEELEDYIVRFYKRKMDAPFSKEMIRSMNVMLEEWTKKQ